MTNTTRTRQVIEAEAALNSDLPAVLRILRAEWVTAPVGMCDTADHGDRVAVEVKKMFGTWFHNCQTCKDSQDRAITRQRRARADAGLRGARAQTQHRQ